MKILVDENIPSVSVHELRSMPFAQAEGRMLVTTDKGFSEHRHEQDWGILVVRLRQPNEQRIHARIVAAFRQFAVHDWPNLLVVMRDAVQSVYRG